MDEHPVLVLYSSLHAVLNDNSCGGDHRQGIARRARCERGTCGQMGVQGLMLLFFITHQSRVAYLLSTSRRRNCHYLYRNTCLVPPALMPCQKKPCKQLRTIIPENPQREQPMGRFGLWCCNTHHHVIHPIPFIARLVGVHVYPKALPLAPTEFASVDAAVGWFDPHTCTQNVGSLW